MPAIGEERGGFALVLALLALLVLAGIASAALAAGWGQVRAANRAGEVLARQTWARTGVDAAIESARGWSSAVPGGPPVELSRDTVGTWGRRRVLDLRIAPEFHLFVGEAAVSDGAAMRHIRVAWWMDPESRVAGHRAVLEGETVTISSGAQVMSASFLDERPAAVPACGGSPILARAFAPPGVLLSGPLPQLPEWGGGGLPDQADLRLGRFTESMLKEFADREPFSQGAPRPICPSCWSGLVFDSRSSRLFEEGAGVLAVGGDLTLVSGSSWTGLVLAAGDVTVEGGSRVVGLLRAGGALTVEAGAVVDGSACAALEALRNLTSLARPLPVPGRPSAGPVAPGEGWD